METELAKSAIDELNPLFKLRYSATHKQVHNLVYRLGPADAYQKGLVKKIEVFGTEIASTGEIVFEIEKIITKKDELPKVRALLETKSNAVYAKKSLLLREGDNLQDKTKNRLYADISVGTIDARLGTVELSNGKVFSAHDGVQSKEAIFRTQIRETIKTHFRKQRDLGESIKVLSLFFIDEVANYRGDEPLIKKIFEEEFEQFKHTSNRFSAFTAHAVHEGYFAQDRLSENRKKQETGTEKAREKLTYDLILKKQRTIVIV
jgi:type III restriction enzyme